MNLKDFRERLGLTQGEFGAWLSEKNICGRNKEPYSTKTIQAWEQGIRNIPAKIKNIIAEEESKILSLPMDEIKKELLKIISTDELLAEIKRRIEAS